MCLSVCINDEIIAGRLKRDPRNCVYDDVDTRYSEWKDIYSSNQALAVEIQEKKHGYMQNITAWASPAGRRGQA